MTTCPRIVAAIAGLTFAFGSTSQAQPNPTWSKCQFSLCVYASDDTIIGVENAVGIGNVVQSYLSGHWYQLNYSTSLGFDVNAILYIQRMDVSVSRISTPDIRSDRQITSIPVPSG